MKAMKKLRTFALCIPAIFALCIPASAAATVSGTLSRQSIAPGEAVTLTVSMPEATVSSLGVTVTCDSAFEITDGKWLKPGVIANYDFSKHKGVYTPGGAATLEGDIFQVTLTAKALAAMPQSISVTVIGKNGTATVFEETVTKAVTIACADHNWDAGAVTAETSCTQMGVKTYTCSYCGAIKTETTNPWGHTYDNGCDTACNRCGDVRAAAHSGGTYTQNAVAAGCETSGYTGDVFCNTCHQQLRQGAVIPAAGHHRTVVNQKNATCREAGYTGDEKCAACHTTLQTGAVIPQLAHTYESGVCSQCGAISADYIPPVTEPPVTEPPATEPPVTEPPVTEPPATEPPATEPPVIESPVTEPTEATVPATGPSALVPDVPGADKFPPAVILAAMAAAAVAALVLVFRKRKR